MRTQVFLALALATAVTGGPVAAPAVEKGHFTLDEAALACLARADREVERRHGAAARVAGPFETVRRHDGWRVSGQYVLGEGRRLRVACDIGAGRVNRVTVRAAE